MDDGGVARGRFGFEKLLEEEEEEDLPSGCRMQLSESGFLPVYKIKKRLFYVDRRREKS